MIRRIIRIDEDKCNGCGLCAAACHEGAIAMVNGKARLTREDYCDGLGDCLPACPTGAISFEEREAPAYDEAAVKAAQAARAIPQHEALGGPSMLGNWPVQIKLAPVNAPCFAEADLLIAADCTAYAYGAFHQDFLKGLVALIGCPKLDGVNYAEKLTAILANNPVRSVTVTRMTVPCCGGLEMAVRRAVAASGKAIPLRIVTIGTDGTIRR